MDSHLSYCLSRHDARLRIRPLQHIFFHWLGEIMRQAGWKQGMKNHRRLVDAQTDSKMDVATADLRQPIESPMERI
jgi:hypothetical protein